MRAWVHEEQSGWVREARSYRETGSESVVRGLIITSYNVYPSDSKS